MGYRSPEYYEYMRSPEWRARSRFCRSCTRHRCVLFPWLRARHAHHITYDNFKSEYIVRDIVALSATAHEIVHLKMFWKPKTRPYIAYWLRFCMVCSILFWWTIGLIILR